MEYNIDDVIGLNEANKEMDDAIHSNAPKCHFKPMSFETGDYDSYESDKWVCQVCGHSKEVNH